MRAIHISEDTYAELLRRVESFDDTAELVIRRLLSGAGAGAGRAEPEAADERSPRPGPAHRAKDFELPLLRALDAAGGELTTNEAQQAVEKLLGATLNDKDHELLGRGEMRWKNQLRFARLSLKRQGQLDETAGWGRWRITAAGRERLARES